jgi:hypothetical protein
MNLGLSREGAFLVADAIIYFLSRHSQHPDILLDLYPGVDVKEILTQLHYIQQLGESEEEYQRISNIIKGK